MHCELYHNKQWRDNNGTTTMARNSENDEAFYVAVELKFKGCTPLVPTIRCAM